MGLSPQDVTDITQGWQSNMAAVQKKILASKAYNWQVGRSFQASIFYSTRSTYDNIFTMIGSC